MVRRRGVWVAFRDLKPCEVAARFPHFGNGVGEVGAHGSGEGSADILACAAEEAEEGAVWRARRPRFGWGVRVVEGT